MESRSSTPFQIQGKTQAPKPRAVQKPNANEPHASRQRRVFGSVKNPNIPAKIVHDKPIKPSISNPEKKTVETSNSKEKSNAKPKPKPKPKKKQLELEWDMEENKNPSNSNSNSNSNSICTSNSNISEPEPQTPVVVAAKAEAEAEATGSGNKSRTRSRVISISTPYQSAVNCSKCRFDRLETASYWVAQIKLAESVSKHFVSASFFRLAIESKAQPKMNLRNELKRYLVRHERLRKETEWIQVSLGYGLMSNDVEAGRKQQPCPNS